MTVGEKLRRWRDRVGLSQAAAAAAVGTHQRTWSDWERGKTPEVDYCDAIERLTRGHVSTRDWIRARRQKRKDAAAAESGTTLPDDDEPHAEAS